MAPRLPSLNALKAFEAAGRHLSFTRAAQELHVTQAAISHQIKGLEEQLGIRLFRRGPRGLLLTDAGQSYLPAVRQAFEQLSQATETLLTRDVSGVLTVSVLPSFGAKWLVPRLRRFRASCPDLDVRVSANEDLVDFERDDVDLAVRYGRGVYPGLCSEWLMAEVFFPVCSPLLAREGPHPLDRPEDLRFHTLLHDDISTSWEAWLAAAGVKGINVRRGPAFDDSSMLLQAAVDGQGVALGRSALAADDLAAGRLIRPFDLSLPAEFAYFVVYPERYAARPGLAQFRDWLLEEAATESDPARDAPPPLVAPGQGV